MAVVITLNAILAFGVIVIVVAPLVWAILTQQRDLPDARPYQRRRPRLASQAAHAPQAAHASKAAHGTRSRQLEPVA